MADRYPTSDAPELVAPLEAHRIDTARLAGWLSNHVPAAARGLQVQQFQGGMSNPTYLIEVADGQRFVIRKKPPGKLLPKAHQIDREHRVMDALAGSGVPVPQMIALCEDPDVIGADFFVMEFVDGRIIKPPTLDTLAVGDRTFRGRATERIQEMADEASSIVVVSHNLAEIARMCTRVLWLDQGQVKMTGPAAEVLDAYEASTGGEDPP